MAFRALSVPQSSVTNFTTARKANTARFTNAKRGKIIVEDKLFVVVAHNRIDQLFIITGSQE